MKWADVTDADLIGALNAVTHAHDKVAAENLIEYFHERFSNEMPYNNEVLLSFVKLAFKRIADDGWSADHAFGLKLKRGLYLRDDTTERDVRATAFVILRVRQGWRWSDAVGGAANLLMPDGRGEDAIRTAYAKYRDTLSLLPDDTLGSFLPAGTPVVSGDMTR